MRKHLFPALIVLTLLLSCAKEQFAVDALSVTSDSLIHINADGTRETESKVVLKAEVEGAADESFSFRLTSPDGDLSWESELFYEQELELTPGALFPEGTYDIIIYSSNGTEYTGTVSYHGIPDCPYYSEEGLTRDSYTEEFTKGGQRVAFGKRSKGYQPSYYAETTIIKVEDGWGSTVTLTQDLI